MDVGAVAGRFRCARVETSHVSKGEPTVAARLQTLSVRGLRCLDGMRIAFDPLTALIGSNGVGKSTTIRALQFLFGQVSLLEHDCTDGATDVDVVITGTFTNLPPEWVERLLPWLDNDNNLTITRSRVIGPEGRVTESWSSTRTQATGFGNVRAAIAQGQLVDPIRNLYKDAQAIHPGMLPAWSSKAKALDAMNAFEQAHPDLVVESSIDGSLRFGAGAGVNLEEMMELLVLPAMRDASQDAAETRGSTLSRLVDLTVRSGMDFDGQLAELSASTNEAYNRILSDAGGEKLNELAAMITRQLSSFAPGSEVRLAWDPKVPALAPPPVRARIIESGHEAEIGHQGHGVQRAYVFSLLRALLEARQLATDARPGLLLAVEEPEVYQHPVRARYVSGVLTGLAHGADTSTQVLYTTHSPFFVSVDNVTSIRLLRLRDDEHAGPVALDGESELVGAVAGETADPSAAPDGQSGPDESTDSAETESRGELNGDLVLPGMWDHASVSPTSPTSVADDRAHETTPAPGSGSRPRTRATAPSLTDIAARLEEARDGTGQAWTEERVAAQLPGLLGTSVSEGFFAAAVALVEGEEDAGFIQGAADARGVDLAELGIAIIAVGGKAPLPLAHEVFRAVGVPTHVVFDTDVKDGNKSDHGSLRLNAILTWLIDGTAAEQPETTVTDHYTSAHTELSEVVNAELGADLLKQVFAETMKEMGLSKEARKNGHLVRVATARAYRSGSESTTLNSLVDRLTALTSPPTTLVPAVETTTS